MEPSPAEPIGADTIPAALLAARDHYCSAEALADATGRLSYEDLAEQAEEVARALVASGVGPGDRVGIWAPNSAAWVVASFGVYLAAAVLVPLNTRYRGHEAGHVLRSAEVTVLLTVGEFLGTDYLALLEGVKGLENLRESVVMTGSSSRPATSWGTFVARATSVERAEVGARVAGLGADTVSDIIFTSGTTGAPKGAMLTHGASVRTYREWASLVGLRERDRYLLVYPLFHTAGLKSGVLASVLTGTTILPQAVFDVPTVMATVAEERISMLPGPPTVFQSILDSPDLGSYDLSSLRLAVTGASVVPVSVIERMRAELPFENVVTGYGLTETTGTVSMCRHDDPVEVIAHTVGRPLPGVEVKVLDDDGNELAQGQPGEFLVRGFNVMKGYFKDPEATAAVLDSSGWLRTGDIGYVDDGGNLRITDRKKDMFIVGGFNAYPAEIEGIMLTHPGVAQVAVVGVADERMGEVGVAFVVPRAGHELTEDSLRAWCREAMANFKVPRRFELVEDLPLTPSGKVMKFELRNRLDGDASAETKTVEG